MQRQVDNRRRALRSRLAIDDAISHLRTTTGCSDDEAFTDLWARAEGDESRLFDIVREGHPPQRDQPPIIP